jgi:hypothetical protein
MVGFGSNSDMVGGRSNVRCHLGSRPKLAKPVNLVRAISVFCFEMA